MSKNALIVLLAGVLAACVFLFAVVWNSAPDRKSETAIQVPENMGGSFTLTNQDGEKESTRVHKGKYKLVYFGFTHCPAICPTELQKIAQAMHDLGPQASQVQPIFVTVDPERDTVAVMKDYVDLFNMGLVGYTGTKEEIEAVKKQYRIYAAQTQEEGMSEYTVDHSSFIYLLNGEDKVVDLYKTEDAPEVIAARVKALLPNP